ncbi:MAG: alpha/beta fold hydrolase [Actinomycetota bacterium]|nr:alpha/beta fold hydrolase [Actinomycetota bacterium]
MRVLGWVAATLAVAVLAAVVGAGWHYSNVLREDGLLAKPEEAPTYDLPVLDVTEETITLPRTAATAQDGVWGLQWEDGYAQVGPVLAAGPQQLTRELRPLGELPEVGQKVRLDGYAFPGDPRSAFSLTFREVEVVSELGRFPAWLVEGSSDTWAIFVHGKGAELRQSLRALRPVAELGLPALVISYRNDPGAPATPDRLHHFGRTEWEDVQAAVDYALEEGAERFLLVGYSMGGAIAVNFLYESPVAELVEGAVLDSSVLDLGATVDWEGDRRDIPPQLTTLAKAISSVRFGISWSAMDLVARSEELETPILLFHGEEDETVPIETSRALEAARPQLVTYVQVEGAGHVEAWNANPVAYEASVREFVKRVVE